MKIVWTDGKNKIGFLDRYGHLKIVKKDEILDLEILSAEKTDKTAKKDLVRIKDLKRSIWKHRIIVSFEDDGSWSKDFVGIGLDLYYYLDGNDLKERCSEDYEIRVLYYETR